MNYFQIFNKVMLELSYRPVAVWENIFKTEHLRILENINRVNSDVCLSFEWPFLKKKDILTLPAGAIETEQEISGQILKVYNKNSKLQFCPDAERFYSESMPQNTYSYFNNKILFGKSAVERELTVYYTSSLPVLDAEGSEKALLEHEDDISKIPLPYAEQILVYGTCLKTKANPQHQKFSFWNTLYTMALVNLRAKCAPTDEDKPSITINSRGA